MLTQWIDRIAAHLQSQDTDRTPDTTADLERVSAQLLVEVARADHIIHDSERRTIADALNAAFTLSDAEIEEIVDTALKQADCAVSLHAHVKAVNDRFEKPAKLLLVEQMWRVALADGSIDKNEEYTIRKLADLLYVKHRDFMQAKLRVVEGN